MSDIIDRLKQQIKETLSPEEYEQYLIDVENSICLCDGYYCRCMGKMLDD